MGCRDTTFIIVVGMTMMRPMKKLAVASSNNNVVVVTVELLAPNKVGTPARRARLDCARWAVGCGLAARNDTINIVSQVAAPRLDVVSVVVAKPDGITIRAGDASARARTTIHTADTVAQRSKVPILALGSLHIDVTAVSANIANDVSLDFWLECVAKRSSNEDVSYWVACFKSG